jgi:isochorismate hydrolase
MTPEQRIAQIASKLSPAEADELLTGWHYFKTEATQTEMEKLLHCLDRDYPEHLPEGDDTTNEGKVTQRVLRLAAKLEPQKADELLRSWRYHQTQHSEAELDEIFASYRAERREVVRQELERIFDL